MNSIQRGSAKEEIADMHDGRAMVIEVFTMSMAVVEVGLVGDEVSIGEKCTLLPFWLQSVTTTILLCKVY